MLEQLIRMESAYKTLQCRNASIDFIDMPCCHTCANSTCLLAADIKHKDQIHKRSEIKARQCRVGGDRSGKERVTNTLIWLVRADCRHSSDTTRKTEPTETKQG